MADSINYRLALILPHSRQVVAARGDDTFLLPQISIPLGERPAEQLTRLIEERWRIKSIVLDVVFDDRPDSPCGIIEVRTSLWALAIASLVAVDLQKISNESLMPHEREVLQAILMGEDCGRGPFSRLGWIDDVQTWVHSVIEGSDINLTGETLHLNASGRFCLIRLASSSGTGYWLKAAGEPNAHEFSITTFLAKACPQYVPRLIATRKDWNAWLMEEHGSSLLNSESLEDFRQAVHTMADLQKAFIGRSDALFDACCGDHRNEILHSRVAEMIAYIDEAMALQTSTKVPKLSSSRLRVLKTALDEACSLQQELEIPDSLMHNDISPDSILYDRNRYVFTDWCEAKVGNPFITMEQMSLHAARSSSEPEVWAQALRDEYRACWRDVLTERQIDRSFQLAPLLSMLSYLHESTKFLDSHKRYEPQRLSYSRSLARHIDRVVQIPSLREALCH